MRPTTGFRVHPLNQIPQAAICRQRKLNIKLTRRYGAIRATKE
jgi:hypothetical protein